MKIDMPHQEVAQALVERCSQYAEPGSFGLYKFWVASEEEVTPGVSASIRVVARDLLNVATGALLRSAIQALAVTGKIEDLSHLTALRGQTSQELATEVEAATRYLTQENKTSDQLLEEVCDRETFVAFVLALAEEREQAEKLERANPDRYRIDGALGWKNADIPNYLYAGLSGLEGESSSLQPSWLEFAKFLHSGKVYE